MPLLLFLLLEDDLDDGSLHTPLPFLPPLLSPFLPFIILDPSLGGGGTLTLPSSSLLLLLQSDLSGSGIGVFLPRLLPLFPLEPIFQESVADGRLLAKGAAEPVANVGLLLLLVNGVDGDLDTGAALGA